MKLLHPTSTDTPLSSLGTDQELVELADVMVESAVGYVAVPMGIATGFLIDGTLVDVPMATEEPSVIAAAGFAAQLTRRAGGFSTTASPPITSGQVFLKCPDPDAETRLAGSETELIAASQQLLERMTNRGGGWRGMDVVRLPETGLVRLQFHIDVQDAMGANLVNSVAEAIRPVAEKISGGECLMAILSNASEDRMVSATFSIPVDRLSRGGYTGEQVADRIAAAADLAQEDDSRAVTHNKGIMNGITALALATGNDTRALEAGIHRFASISGRYRGVSTFLVQDGHLRGSLHAPITMGTLGGAMGIHPASGLALELLGAPSASGLSRIAAAVGLGQNFAALYALVSEGIQKGHMGLHANRIAWIAGARGDERPAVVQGLRQSGIFNREEAERILSGIREQSKPITGEAR